MNNIMSTEQAYTNGFIKRAAEYGFNESEAQRLLKQSAIGLGLDAAMLGLPSGAGAMVGSNYAPINDKELREEMAYSEDPSLSKALKYLLMPGYTGYRAAKNKRLEHAYQSYRDKQRMTPGVEQQY